jgi:hypothetical protein
MDEKVVINHPHIVSLTWIRVPNLQSCFSCVTKTMICCVLSTVERCYKHRKNSCYGIIMYIMVINLGYCPEWLQLLDTFTNFYSEMNSAVALPSLSWISKSSFFQWGLKLESYIHFLFLRAHCTSRESRPSWLNNPNSNNWMEQIMKLFTT